MLRTEEGDVIGELSRGIGETTNNVAEYTALIQGLHLARDKGVTDVRVRMDSELVVSQVTGAWKIRNDRLRALAVEARRLLNGFASFDIAHVRRDNNADADRLANQGMDASALDAQLGSEWQPHGDDKRGTASDQDTFFN